MIIVIADDFTGAAELGGIAKQFGLDVEIQTTFKLTPNTDVIVVDTNTRSKTAREAVNALQNLLKSVRQYEFDFLFKKIDSVLRGHVYEELSVLLKYYQKKSILLVPANPSRSRTISNGTYFIKGTPLHKTVFSNDPESPVKASDISSLINSRQKEGIKLLDVFSNIPQENKIIYIGEAKNSKEINYWASQCNENVIPAGAGDFFKAVLTSKKYAKNATHSVKVDFGSRNKLFICGSSLSRVINIKEALFSQNPKVVEVSERQICSSSDANMLKVIADKVINYFKFTNNVILFVNISEPNTDLPTHNIPKFLAAIASIVSTTMELDELFIEGGTTSSEVVRKMGWTQFSAVNQIGEGEVRMQIAKNPLKFITVKPGSYEWTDRLWRQLKS